jgi:hypothetical protein
MVQSLTSAKSKFLSLILDGSQPDRCDVNVPDSCLDIRELTIGSTGEFKSPR